MTTAMWLPNRNFMFRVQPLGCQCRHKLKLELLN